MADRGLNPYVGPCAFEKKDHGVFFGREEETELLSSLVVAYRAVLLHAGSGAGKTSLLNAGLEPLLREREGVVVLPIARVSRGMTSRVHLPSVRNLYVFSVLLCFVQKGIEPKELARLSLSDGLQMSFPSMTGTSVTPHLMVLDQFEELFAGNSGRNAQHERVCFFNELQTCLADYPYLNLLLSMREDYIAHLDSYAAILPDRLRIRFRLELLNEEAALKAIQGPARWAGVPFVPGAAKGLVDDLRRVQIQTFDGKREEHLGLYVEPLQLQIVCNRLWDRLPSGAVEIKSSYVGDLGDVDSALMTYYNEQIAAAVRATKVDEQFIRKWFERELITEDGFRRQTAKVSGSDHRRENEIIEFFVRAHLVRGDRRHGVTWYELVHDRFVKPVQTSNAVWQRGQLGDLQRMTRAWQGRSNSYSWLQRILSHARSALGDYLGQDLGRLVDQLTPKDLFLQGEQLSLAREWARKYPGSLSEAESEFLRASQDYEKMMQDGGILKDFLLIMLSFLIVFLVTFISTYILCKKI